MFFLFSFQSGSGSGRLADRMPCQRRAGRERGVFCTSLGAGREEKEGSASRNRKGGETATLKAIVVSC